MATSYLTLAIAALSLAVPATASAGGIGVPAGAADADRAAITHILDDEGAAWAAGDADAFAAHVLPDVSFTNIVGMFSIGKAPFVAQHKAIFSTIYKGSQVRQYVVALTFVRPDVVVVDCVAKLSGANEIPTGAAAVGGALYTRLEQTMVRTNGSWAIAAFHNVPIQPKFVTPEVLAMTSAAGH